MQGDLKEKKMLVHIKPCVFFNRELKVLNFGLFFLKSGERAALSLQHTWFNGACWEGAHLLHEFRIQFNWALKWPVLG